MTPALARHSDVDDLVALVESAYRGEASRAGWTTEADLLDGRRLDREAAAEMIDDPSGVVLLVRADDGSALGSVQLRDLGDGTAYFGLFAISPRAQGQGMGSRLMTAAEGYAAEHWQARRMRMTVISKRTELVAFYERRGYELTGETEPFPYGDERFGIPRTDDLEFAVLVKQLV
nr:GNAT family N-acetyltransferase [Brevibacterium daeguense]